MRKPSSLSLLALLTSCAASPPVVDIKPAVPAPVVTSAPMVSGAVAEPPIAAGDTRHRFAFVVHPGEPPCTFVFDGSDYEETADTFDSRHLGREVRPVHELVDIEPPVEPSISRLLARLAHWRQHQTFRWRLLRSDWASGFPTPLPLFSAFFPLSPPLSPLPP